MQRPDSDWDYWVIYQVPSVEFLLGRRHDRGHESSGEFADGMPWDRSSFEIGHHVNNLMKNNINHVISVFSMMAHNDGHATTYTYYPVKGSLRRIMSENPAKNIYWSVNGMTTKNLNKYFDEGRILHWSYKTNGIYKGEELEKWIAARVKKLGQIRRMVEFGFRVLTTGEYDFRGVLLGDGGYEDEQNVRQWQADLQKAYDASDLPEQPDPEPFENWLIELRMGYFEHEE
jgi:hypothetical protein